MARGAFGRRSPSVDDLNFGRHASRPSNQGVAGIEADGNIGCTPFNGLITASSAVIGAAAVCVRPGAFVPQATPRADAIGPHESHVHEVRDARQPDFLPGAARRVGISFQSIEGTRFEIFPEML